MKGAIRLVPVVMMSHNQTSLVAIASVIDKQCKYHTDVLLSYSCMTELVV